MKEDAFSLTDELGDLCYRWFFTALIALFAFFEIFFETDPGLITLVNILTVIVISMVFCALFLLYRRVRLFMLPAILIVSFIIYLAVDKNEIVNVIESTFFALFMIGMSSFVLFLIIDRVMLLNMGVALAGLIYLAIKACNYLPVYPVSPVLFVLYAFAVIIRFSRDGIKSGDINRLRKYMTFLFPFISAFLLILILLPKPEQPISWQWAVRLYNRAAEKLEKVIHGLTTRYGRLDYDYFTISFGMDESMTYDNDKGHESDLFEVTVNGGAVGSIYLKGELFNEFKDGTWQNTLEAAKDYTRSDANETRRGIDTYEAVPYGSVARDASVRIKFLDITSPIVFTPSKFVSFTDISARKQVHGDNEHLLFDGNISYGSEYAVSYVQLNIGNTVFADYMNDPAKPESLRSDGLDGYREYVSKNYTSSPMISDGVRGWLEGATQTGDSGYDKLLLLEGALSGFKYESKTEALPAYVKSEGDYLEYFLFEKREGYCVHFATAFCLLARCMGYPSRVVQGYKAPAGAGVTTVITDSMGHAWPEVYFEGKGWIPFEPTPGMSAERYAGWEVKEGSIKSTEQKKDERVSEQNSEQDEEENPEQREKATVPLIMILAVAGIAVVSLAMLLAARAILIKRRKARMNTGELYCAEFARLEKALKELGLKRAPYETLSEFAMRADVPGLCDCITVLENYVYGGRIPANEEILLTDSCGRIIDGMMRERFGKMYFLHRLRLWL